tara:strand:+ start:174 stop:545 length:372 start_codon:yes stop_codon:yes gene_type:complete
MENHIVITYLTYLPIVLLMTFLVAKILFKNSIIFILDIFKGRKEIAIPTNRLLEIGFYLLNVGTALLILKTKAIETTQQMVEILSLKIGGFSIYLGIMLFAYIYLFFRGKKKSNQRPRNVVKS